jgi:hypothetical protein
MFKDFNIIGKTITVSETGSRTEDMKLCPIDFGEWCDLGAKFEESDVYDYFLSHQFLCIIFKETKEVKTKRKDLSYMKFRKNTMGYEIAELLSSVIEQLETEEIADMVELPPQREMGDFAFPCFKLAKIYRKAPNLIAEDITSQIKSKGYDIFADVQNVGGYINFFIAKEEFARQIIKTISSENFGSSQEGEGKTICIDYSSPNVAKNFHVGHLRTTIIGNSLYKIYSKLGYHVERINHLGDWGTQFGKMIVAYKLWGNKNFVHKHTCNKFNCSWSFFKRYKVFNYQTFFT